MEEKLTLSPQKTWMKRLVSTSFVLALGIVIGIFTLAFVAAGVVYEYEDSAQTGNLPSVDAIVVLAGGRGRIRGASDIWFRYWQNRNQQYAFPKPIPKELPDQTVQERLEESAPKKVPMLFVSGMGPQADWKVFASRVSEEVLKALKEDDVFLETESSNTDENARWVGRYMEEQGWSRILLVTSSYHMRRAQYIFYKVLKATPGLRTDEDFKIDTLSIQQEPFTAGSWRGDFLGIQVTLTEYLKWVYYRSLL